MKGRVNSMLKVMSNDYGIESARKYYVQYESYVVFMAGDTAYTRRLYADKNGSYFNFKSTKVYVA